MDQASSTCTKLKRDLRRLAEVDPVAARAIADLLVRSILDARPRPLR